MRWLFWTSIAFLAYTFAGYPVLLWLLSRLLGRSHRRGEILPKVSVITVVHNQAQHLAEKIRNILALEYPADKLEILVASDASIDDPGAVIRAIGDSKVQVIEIPERRGKHYSQMIARDVSSGEILVFTDVAVRLDPLALRHMVSNFADEEVACVSSEDRISSTASGGERSYVGLEMQIRRMESHLSSVVGVSGSFFAARRELCSVWHSEQSSDFFVPLHAAAMGKRSVVDRNAIGYFTTASKDAAEYHRKLRTIVHGLDVFFSHFSLLSPVQHGIFAWELLSHKLFRWFLPFVFTALLVSSALLWDDGMVYRICFLGQLVVHGAGILAWLPGPLRKVKPIRIAGFFLLGNVATVEAWLRFFAGEKYITWQPTRR